VLFVACTGDANWRATPRTPCLHPPAIQYAILPPVPRRGPADFGNDQWFAGTQSLARKLDESVAVLESFDVTAPTRMRSSDRMWRITSEKLMSDSLPVFTK